MMQESMIKQPTTFINCHFSSQDKMLRTLDLICSKIAAWIPYHAQVSVSCLAMRCICFMSCNVSPKQWLLIIFCATDTPENFHPFKATPYTAAEAKYNLLPASCSLY